MKTPDFRLREDGQHFKTETFRKRWRHDGHVISLTECASNTTGYFCVFKFLRCSVECRLTTTVFNVYKRGHQQIFYFNRRTSFHVSTMAAVVRCAVIIVNVLSNNKKTKH